MQQKESTVTGEHRIVHVSIGPLELPYDAPQEQKDLRKGFYASLRSLIKDSNPANIQGISNFDFYIRHQYETETKAFVIQLHQFLLRYEMIEFAICMASHLVSPNNYSLINIWNEPHYDSLVFADLFEYKEAPSYMNVQSSKDVEYRDLLVSTTCFRWPAMSENKILKILGLISFSDFIFLNENSFLIRNAHYAAANYQRNNLYQEINIANALASNIEIHEDINIEEVEIFCSYSGYKFIISTVIPTLDEIEFPIFRTIVNDRLPIIMNGMVKSGSNKT